MSLQEVVYALKNEEGEVMALGWIHPEREHFHGDRVSPEDAVFSVKEVLEGGKSFYVDPIEDDQVLYVGAFVLWPRKFIGKFTHILQK